MSCPQQDEIGSCLYSEELGVTLGFEGKFVYFYYQGQPIPLTKDLVDVIAQKDEVISRKDEVINQKDEIIAENKEIITRKETENKLLRQLLLSKGISAEEIEKLIKL